MNLVGFKKVDESNVHDFNTDRRNLLKESRSIKWGDVELHSPQSRDFLC